jgi:hypothetical protein
VSGTEARRPAQRADAERASETVSLPGRNSGEATPESGTEQIALARRWRDLYRAERARKDAKAAPAEPCASRPASFASALVAAEISGARQRHKGRL